MPGRHDNPSSLTWRAPGVLDATRPPKTSDRPTAPVPARERLPTGRDSMTDVTDAPTTPDDANAEAVLAETVAEVVTEPEPVASFADFGVHHDIVDALAEHRHHQPVPDPGDDPPGRPRRPRHHRPGQDRHRQDPRLRHPAPAAGHRRPERRRLRHDAVRRQAAGARRRPHPRARRAGRQRPRAAPASCAASACSPSTAAAPTSRRSRRCSSGVEVVVGTPGRLLDLAKQGHLDLGHVRIARARRGRRDARPGLPARRREDPRADPGRRARRCCSRPPCRARSSRWPAAT